MTAFPTRGCPRVPSVAAPEATDLIAFLRTLKPRAVTAPASARFTLTSGKVLDGRVMNWTHDDVQVLDENHKLHLLRLTAPPWSGSSTVLTASPSTMLGPGARYREVTSQADWPTYNGEPSGNRYSPLTQINRATSARWRRSGCSALPSAARLQVTPVVVDGVMYVTARQRVLRARRRQRPPDLALPAAAHARAWSATPPAASIAASASPATACSWSPINAHLIALNRFTGALLWDTEMADWRQNYNATSRAAGGRQPGDLGHLRRRRRRARIRRRVRSGHRQGSLALLDRAAAAASRDRRRGRARASSIRRRRRG